MMDFGRYGTESGKRKAAAKSGFLAFSFCLLTVFSAAPACAEKAPLPPKVSKTYNLDYVGQVRTHVAAYEDTLVKLARANNLGFVEMRAANPHVDPWMPGKGTALKMPTMHLLPQADREGIIINLPEMRIYAFVENGKPPVTFPIGVGRAGLETPQGKTSVIRKTEGPTWRPTKRMREEDPTLPRVVEPGPENPLGTHALYLGWPQYAIHGTNRPFGIGRRVSSGCVRLYPEHIPVFYKKIEVGTPVAVVNQPVKAGWIGDEFHVEAHTSLQQADKVEKEGGLPTYELTKQDMEIILKAAGKHARDLNWQKIRRVVRERRGYPVAVGMRAGGKDAEKPRHAANENTPPKSG